MKTYIQPITEICAAVDTELIMVSVNGADGSTVIPGGGSAGDGSGIVIGGKGRGGHYATEYDEEFDPILQLLIDQEEGNNSNLW